MRVAIVGSREWGKWKNVDYRVLTYVALLAARAEQEGEALPEIVAGDCPTGVDRWAKDAARYWGCPYKGFPADWKPDGVNVDRRAGFRRNQQIVDYADRVVAFWDGTSPGTKDTITKALAAHKHLEVIFP